MLFMKRMAIALCGLLMAAGVFTIGALDAQAGVDFEIGSYVTACQDTALFNSVYPSDGTKCEVPDNAMCLVVENDELYTLVTYNGVTGYLWEEYTDIDQEVIAAYEAELEAERLRQEAEALARSEEIAELAALIQLEAGGESYEGMVAVGAVVMNRVKCPAYPSTIHDVIYQSGQFTPAGSGRVATLYASGTMKQACRDAAIAAYTGTDNTGGALHFHRANGAAGLVIGNQVFF